MLQAALLLVAATIQSTLAQTDPMCAPFDAYDQLAGFEGFCRERVEISGWNRDQPEFDGVDEIRIFERNAIFGEEVFDFKDNVQVPLPVRAYRRNLRPGH